MFERYTATSGDVTTGSVSRVHKLEPSRRIKIFFAGIKNNNRSWGWAQITARNPYEHNEFVIVNGILTPPYGEIYVVFPGGLEIEVDRLTAYWHRFVAADSLRWRVLYEVVRK